MNHYVLDCSDFYCRNSDKAEMVVVKSNSIKELREMKPKCNICGSPLKNYISGTFPPQSLPIIKPNHP